MKDIVMDWVYKYKLIAIVRGIEYEHCMETAQALYDGGVRMIEFPYCQSNPDSWVETAQIISDIQKHFEGKLLIGAGTVTTVDLVELTYKADGKYIISPDTNLDVIKRTKELGMCSMPGAFSPSEITTAYRAGADIVKIFPASVLGTQYIRAITSPLDNIPCMAVGGINEGNAASFLQAGAVAVGVGGNLAKKEWIEASQFDKINQSAVNLVQAIV